MDPVDQSSVTPNKRRLVRTFAKVLHIRAMTGISPAADGVQKTMKHDHVIQKSKSRDPIKHNGLSTSLKSVFEEEKLQTKASTEAFLAKVFASVSSIKAAYAQMQFAESPYDADGIQSADEEVVSELKFLSELKQSYLKKLLDDPSPETTQSSAEIKEQKSLSKTLEIMGKKLDSQLKRKHAELTFLREKLEEANKENKMIEKRLNMSGSLSPRGNLNSSGLSTSLFVEVFMQTIRSIRSFVQLIVSGMESAGWDLDAAADSIEPGVVYSSASHRCFAFESFVCRQMFEGFNYPFFSQSRESSPENKSKQQFFNRFLEVKSQKPREYLALKPKSAFAKFCRKKYLRLVHPRMEESLFNNLDQRHSLESGVHPETTFYTMFTEMAKLVWQLHCLAFSFQPVVSIFQVSRRSRFSEMYTDCVNDEAFLSSSETNRQVAFTVVPGFKIGKVVIQAQVYLS